MTTTKSLPIKYRMRNTVNGASIELLGKGTISEHGVMDLTIAINSVPPDWTGVIVPCICSGPGGGGQGGDEDPIMRLASGFASARGLFALSPQGYRTSKGTLRLATLFDEQGQPIAAVRAIGIYLRDKSSCDFDIGVYTTTRPGSIISELTSVDSYAFSILPAGLGKVEVHSHYTLSTDDGRIAYGATRIFYDLENSTYELTSPLMGRNEISVDWQGKSLKYTSKQTVFESDFLGRI